MVNWKATAQSVEWAVCPGHFPRANGRIGGTSMAKVWCEWESSEYERDQFELYHGGPLLRHLHVEIPHTNNGIGIGAGPAHYPHQRRRAASLLTNPGPNGEEE